MSNISKLNGADAVELPSISENRMLTAALHYAERGWRVFPLKAGDKTPMTSHGCLDATMDVHLIRQWWKDTPNANIGIATGVGSGVLVLDVDMGGEKVGDKSLAAMISQHGEMPPTLIQRTGGGGNQYFFKYPNDEYKYGNKANLAGFKHIDVRGEGGYVVAPPSIHPSGGTYAWANDIPMGDAPPWLLAMISNKNAPNAQLVQPDALEAAGDTLASVPTAEVHTLPMQPIEVPQVADEDRQRYRLHLQKRAAEYLAKDAGAVQGSGGDAHTFAIAGNLLALECCGERLTVGDVIAVMNADWNGRCSPPWDFSELASKVKSAASNGTARTVKACKVCGGEDIGESWGVHAAEVKSYSPTNLGDGQLFADTFRHELMFVSEWKRWMKWSGKRWEAVPPEGIRRYAHRLVAEVMPLQAVKIKMDDERIKYIKHIAASHQSHQLDAMLKEATAYMGVEVKQLDADAMLFNLQNGTMDCRTGELRLHRREDFISKLSPCSYDPSATCPTWEKFINRIMVGDNGQTDMEMVQYLQTAMGYSITGSVKQDCMLVLWGNGGNGKGTFTETVLHCLGDYGHAMASSVLLSETQGGNNDAVADLHGVRFAVANETKKGCKFNEERVKSLTGGDTIWAMRKYERPFSFQPTHKFWLSCNDRPNVSPTDEGMWRRLRLVPFTATFSATEKDMGLKGRDGKLIREQDGIMGWIIVGLKRWLETGLPIPKEVEQATAVYREECDDFGTFISDTCVKHAAAAVKSSDLFKSYKRWADDNGVKFTLTHRTMAKKMRERGYSIDERADANYWDGIGLRGGAGEVILDDRPF